MSKFSDWLFEVDDEEAQALIDILNKDVDELCAHKAAIAKCENMIADAIAKAEILIIRDGEFVEDENYYRLNIQPNDNETGTDFWKQVTKILLHKSECVIVPLNEKFYIASQWTCDDVLLHPKRYSQIVLQSCGISYPIKRTFKADDIIHMRYHNEDIIQYFTSVLGVYDKILSTISSLVKLSNAPKFQLKYDGQLTLIDRETGQKLSVDQYEKRIASILDADKLSIIRLGQGVELSQIKIETNESAASVKTVNDMIGYTAAKAFGIPQTVYDGTVTEKSDADNEFMTYAVEPLVEVINDSLNAKVIGMDDYVSKKERIQLFTGNHKHRDVLDSAAGAEKLRGIGFSLDEVRKMVGYMPLNTSFSRSRAITKNFETEEGNENAE